MKILIFSPYYPPHTGGLESHADEFNKYLSRKGTDITVFTPHLPASAPKKETRHNDVKIIRFPAFEIIPNYPLPKFWKIEFWQLFFSLFREKFDIILSRTRFFNTSILALIYTKIKKTRWIHIEHGSDFVQLSSKFKTFVAKIYDYTFGWIVFRNCDLNISISETVQKFVKKFNKKNSPVIYRGLEMDKIDKIDPDLVIKNNYPKKIIIAFVGRLYKWKGVENSIKAIKLLPEKIKDNIVFLIIGDGEDFNYLKELSKEEKTIEMLGNLPREKTIGILKTTDIYIHSAYPGGGLSTSLLEAMYCGCAVIATPNEGANEVVTNGITGSIITAGSQEDIAEKISELIASEEKRNFYSLKAKELISKRFNWISSVDKYEKIFNS